MSRLTEKAAKRYSDFLFEHSETFLLALLVISGLLISGAQNIETVEDSTEDLLPGSAPVISAFNALKAEFPGADANTYRILIEVSPDHADSNEIRDVRDPRFLRYTELISNEIGEIDKIESVSGPSNLFTDIPSSKRDVIETMGVLGEDRWSQYISDDYQAVRIEATSEGLTVEEEMKVAGTITESIDSHSMSNDFKISYTGQNYIDMSFKNETKKTMSITGMLALIGVLITVILLFRSVFHGLNSLLTLVFGLAVGLGIFGLLGFNMNSGTSAAISMGVGIAIDFGIQPVARYREERNKHEIKKSLENMFEGVITPMTVGLIAANIGFLTLTVGQITFLSDLGILLALSTTFAYVTAFTIVPAVLVLYDRYITRRVLESKLINSYSR